MSFRKREKFLVSLLKYRKKQVVLIEKEIRKLNALKERKNV